jgi:hypothetical protein
VQRFADVMPTVRRGAAQPAVERRPAHAAGVRAERDRADSADDNLSAGFDDGFADRAVRDIRVGRLVDLLEALPEAVRGTAAQHTENAGLHDRARVEALPVSLDYLDELRKHLLGDFLGRLLRHFGDEFRDVSEEGVVDFLNGEPAEAEELGNEFDGERIGHRPDDIQGGHDYPDDH